MSISFNLPLTEQAEAGAGHSSLKAPSGVMDGVGFTPRFDYSEEGLADDDAFEAELERQLLLDAENDDGELSVGER